MDVYNVLQEAMSQLDLLYPQEIFIVLFYTACDITLQC